MIHKSEGIEAQAVRLLEVSWAETAKWCSEIPVYLQTNFNFIRLFSTATIVYATTTTTVRKRLNIISRNLCFHLSTFRSLNFLSIKKHFKISLLNNNVSWASNMAWNIRFWSKEFMIIAIPWMELRTINNVEDEKRWKREQEAQIFLAKVTNIKNGKRRTTFQ